MTLKNKKMNENNFEIKGLDKFFPYLSKFFSNWINQYGVILFSLICWLDALLVTVIFYEFIL
tara:strand:+ start:280 stop:465 length:186 start_codon:yes stop_codon:yes gene_type:complete